MKINIVTGAPASGKTSYVRQHAQKNALVYDFDILMKAITNNELYENNYNLINYVDSLRYDFIEVAQQSNVDELWIISLHFKPKLETALDGLDYEVIKVIASKSECINRIKADDTRKNKSYWISLIEQYFKGDEEL